MYSCGSPADKAQGSCADEEAGAVETAQGMVARINGRTGGEDIVHKKDVGRRVFPGLVCSYTESSPDIGLLCID